MILSFELTMPGVSSWNGKWSGQEKKYYRHRSVSTHKANALFEGPSKRYHYSFGDGWVACVTVRPCTASDKRRQEKVSAGFWGYEWMIDEILEHGKILTLAERQQSKAEQLEDAKAFSSVSSTESKDE